MAILSHRSAKDGKLACLTADLIASRDLGERASVQTRLRDAIVSVNRKLGENLAAPFSITVGDEWQGLAYDVGTCVAADLCFRRLLHPLRFASGIGLGAISTPMAARTGEMDGPCFHRARAALVAAAKHGASATGLQTGDDLFDETVAGYTLLLHLLSDSWTQKQLQVFEVWEQLGTETATAARLGVSQPTVHQSLARSSAKTYVTASRALIRFVSEYVRATDATE